MELYRTLGGALGAGPAVPVGISSNQFLKNHNNMSFSMIADLVTKIRI
jgi:hypothetical protein